jgi:hypothetical protein
VQNFAYFLRSKKRVKDLETKSLSRPTIPTELFEYKNGNYYDDSGNQANEAYLSHQKQIAELEEKYGASEEIHTVIVVASYD